MASSHALWLVACRVIFQVVAGIPEEDELRLASFNGASYPWINAWNSDSELAKLAMSGVECDVVRDGVLTTINRGHDEAQMLSQALLDKVSALVPAIDQDAGTAPYHVLFGEPSRMVLMAFNIIQFLSMVGMTHKRCFSSAARLTMGRAMLPLQKSFQQQVSTMWWMFDIGSFSNTNSPKKHLQAVYDTIVAVNNMFAFLVDELPAALDRLDHFWGHEEHGMFMNSTVFYRKLFPEKAIVDKGILRFLLQIFPHGASVADFGSLDGQYAAWLNETGWVTAFAFDGVSGIDDITEGKVSYIDLSQEFRIHWQDAFDWVMSIEVAEHIPPQMESTFLSNVNRHARSGLVLSWAPPWVEGEGHVNCQPLDESRQRVESMGFRQDEEATIALRKASQISWISESIAIYRRV
eukprot:gnl/MRDRNA2_/MRDRNA2_23082_c0_seq2.p1 gnl/MRDRNA2_/MRDRNA2_23082_c0~~gnl/MRDRNA2_/MRDRNA2_23082_c0_seq2.p1  ORF type:complete len:407 (+),score=74.90 gnl/MRDRNA2_/MRDRNA2_23082_c0_seq2:92-1312(+)